MKKLILALLAVSTITAANAQKNSILVYGSAGANFDNDNMSQSNAPSITKPWTDVDVNNKSYFFAPGIGYQFNRNMTIGIQGAYSSAKTEWLQNQTHLNWPTAKTAIETDEWTVGAFYRYTKYLSTLFSVYGQVNAGYVQGDVELSETVPNIFGANTLQTNASTEYNGFQGEIFPAFAINVHKGWALNFGFGGIRYRSLSYDSSPTMGINNTGNPLNPYMGLRPDHSNQFDFTLGQQINLTITKNIGCGKIKRSRGGNMDTGDDARRSGKDRDKDADEDDE